MKTQMRAKWKRSQAMQQRPSPSSALVTRLRMLKAKDMDHENQSKI